MSVIDTLFTECRLGDRHAFADWAGRVERPVRASLVRFARAVDLEVVMQETLMRMWLLAGTDKSMDGENASLRFAIRVARNVALEELRRTRPGTHVALEEVEEDPELWIAPTPEPDPGLARAILDCLEKLPDRLARALRMRIDRGMQQPDRILAETLGLKLNTFLQHIVRARKRMDECLRGKGVELPRVPS